MVLSGVSFLLFAEPTTVRRVFATHHRGHNPPAPPKFPGENASRRKAGNHPNFSVVAASLAHSSVLDIPPLSLSFCLATITEAGLAASLMKATRLMLLASTSSRGFGYGAFSA